MYKYLFILIVVFSVSCSSGNKQVKVSTEFGDMVFELYNSTPQHRDNFVKLVKEQFYDDLLFHRVINGFMVQGGDPNSRGAAPNLPLGSGGPGYTIPAEIAAPHFKGTLAAARTGDAANPEKKSSGSQFYIVQGKPVNDNLLNSIESQKGIKYSDAQREKYKQLGGTPQLDMEYTVFGEIVSGIEVIDKIAEVPVNGSRPTNDVKMTVTFN